MKPDSFRLRRSTIAALALLFAACGGSDDPAPPPPLQRDDPVRDWRFFLYRGDNGSVRVEELPAPNGQGTQVGGVLDKVFDFGPIGADGADFKLVTPGGTIAPNGQASGHIFATNNGATYGVFAEAPFGKLGGINQPGAPQPVGADSSLLQRQSYIKRAADATLSFTLSDVLICAYDYNLFPPTFGLDDFATRLVASVSFSIAAWDRGGRMFFEVGGTAQLSGTRDAWDPPGVFDMGEGALVAWEPNDFDYTEQPLADPFFGTGTQACLELNGSVIYEVDLSSIDVDQEFSVQSTALAHAVNKRGGGAPGDHQMSGAAAYLRDPASIGGTTIAYTGLEPTNRPDAAPPPAVPVAPAACARGPSPDPAAGAIEFTAPTFTVSEQPGSAPVILVRRSGGSRGAVSATFTARDGSAIAGTDYTPTSHTVFFADGQAGPRAVRLPIIDDAIVQPAKTVNLALSQPGGCAAIGPQATAVLTIVDDDQPPAGAATFSVGGTVTGLVGSGLVLTNSSAGDLPITANGTFTFAQALGDRLPYDVRVKTQPSSPLQLCAVTRGSGTIAGAHVTNVAVDCAGAPAPTGLDTSFGAAGKVTTPSSGIARAVALQADGGIVTAGGAFTLTRHRADGSLDAVFGSGGKVTTSFGSGAGSANDVAIQPDGRIVVVGSARASVGSSSGDNFALRRYLSDGSLDPDFGSGGGVDTDFAAGADIARAVAIQPDGRIVVAGQARIGNANDFAVARYNADGTLDASFGSGGKVTTDIAGGSDGLPMLALQPDGKIVLAGRFGSGNSVGGAAVVRLLANGSLDPAFGTGGKVTVTGSVDAEAIALQADGAILVAGTALGGTGGPAFGVMRLLADGRVDAAFGTATTRFFSSGNGSFARNLAVQADGRIVLVGEAASGASNTFDMAIARFDANGVLDTSFGAGGHVVVDLFGEFDGAVDLAIQTDGKLVVAGLAENGLPTEFALVRMHP